MTRFDAIHDRCVAKDWDAALDLALVAWRETRAPAYANLVEAISAQMTRAPIPTRSGEVWYDQLHHRWLARARSLFAVEVPVLMDAFAVDLRAHETRAAFDELPAARRVRAALAKEGLALEANAEGPFMAIAVRLEILTRFQPDPRIAKGLVRFLKLAPVVAEGALAVATYGPVFDVIEELGDVRVLPALEALPPSNARDRTIEALRARGVPPLVNDEVMTLAKELGFTEAAPVLDVSELLEMVVADLDDDTPRAILGDLWLEAGDPRGEFVQLQLRAARGELSTAERERMVSIEAQNHAEWLGDLSLITTARRFERGFLDEIALANDSAVSRARWARAMRDPRLGTVRVVRPGAASAALFGELLLAPSLKNLVALEIPHLRDVRLLDSTARPSTLRRVEVVLPANSLIDADVTSRQVEALLETTGLDVTVTLGRHAIGDLVRVLPLARKNGTVVLRAIDVELRAERANDGLVLYIVSRDAKLVDAALEACRGAVVTIRRPHGAKLFGPDTHTRRLANFLKNNPRERVTLDASWTELLRR